MARTNTGFFFVKTRNGAPPAIQQFSLDATACYEGGVAILKTTGSVTNYTTDGTSIAGVFGANVSLTRASYATTTVPVYIADNNNVFESRVPGISISDCKDYLGDLIDVDGTASAYRLCTASSKQARVVGYHPDDVAKGATGARLWVTFAKNAWTDKASDVR